MRSPVVVWDCQRPLGWDGETEPGEDGLRPFSVRDGERRPVPLFPVMELEEALFAQHATDAHLSCYALWRAGEVVPRVPRTNIAALEHLPKLGADLRMTVLAFDADDRVKHGTGQPARDGWRAEFEAGVRRLEATLDVALWWYHTRGGARVLYPLAEPLDVAGWHEAIVGLLRLAQDAGLEPDLLHDAQRCFRLPNVVRDGVRQRFEVHVGQVCEPAMVACFRMEGQARPLETQRRQSVQPPPPPPSPSATPGERPGDWFNAHVSWGEILGPHGWTFLGLAGGKEEWQRPGAKTVSARTNTTQYGNTTLHVHSSNAAPFEAGESYTRFKAYAVLNHGGDEKAAARAIGEQNGLVRPEDPTLAPFAKALAEAVEAVAKAAPKPPADATWHTLEALVMRYALSVGTVGRLVESGQIARDAAGDRYQVLDAAITPATPADHQLPAVNDVAFRASSEVVLAAGLAQELEGDAPRVVHALGDFWRYEHGCWARWTTDELERRVNRWDGRMVGGVDERTGEAAKPKKLSIGASLRRGIIECLRVERSREDFFEAAPAGVAFRNAFVSVSKAGLEVVPHHPRQRATFMLAGEYTPGDPPEQLLGVLRYAWELDADCDEKIAFVQEWIGIALVGRAPEFGKILFLLGKSHTGKSVVTRCVAGLFPRDAVSAVPAHLFDEPYHAIKLAGARLNLDDDLISGEFIATGNFKKAVTGSGPITGRHPGERSTSFVPTAAHLIAGNESPIPQDKSDGFFRRWATLRFDRVVSDAMRITGYAEQILAHERGAIAAWALEGAARALARGGYAVPKSCNEIVQEWKHDANPVQRFFDEALEPSPSWARIGDFYADYVTWSEKNGHKAVASNTFGKRARQFLEEGQGIMHDGKHTFVAFRKRLVPSAVPAW